MLEACLVLVEPQQTEGVKVQWHERGKSEGWWPARYDTEYA